MKKELRIIEKIHAFEFISRIIVHIADSNFKQIRFYGAYHNSTKIKIDVVRFLSNELVNFKRTLNKWRTMITISFKKDALTCPHCNNIMVYYYSVYT